MPASRLVPASQPAPLSNPALRITPMTHHPPSIYGVSLLQSRPAFYTNFTASFIFSSYSLYLFYSHSRPMLCAYSPLHSFLRYIRFVPASYSLPHYISSAYFPSLLSRTRYMPAHSFALPFRNRRFFTNITTPTIASTNAHTTPAAIQKI